MFGFLLGHAVKTTSKWIKRVAIQEGIHTFDVPLGEEGIIHFCTVLMKDAISESERERIRLTTGIMEKWSPDLELSIVEFAICMGMTIHYEQEGIELGQQYPEISPEVADKITQAVKEVFFND